MQGPVSKGSPARKRPLPRNNRILARAQETHCSVSTPPDFFRPPRAMTLAENHGLRGYDAIQLSSPLEVNAVSVRVAMPLVFVSADDELNAAVALKKSPATQSRIVPVSLDPALLSEADRYAKSAGISRSRLVFPKRLVAPHRASPLDSAVLALPVPRARAVPEPVVRSQCWPECEQANPIYQFAM